LSDFSIKFISATWGWDSHNERWFYGYTGYFISTYNRELKTDLPLYLRLVEAKRHDSVSAVISLAEFRDLYPDLTVNAFIHDSAADNIATYELLHKWNINAFIALNQKGNFKYPPHLNINDDGIPVCMGGHNMVRWGKCPDRDRIKYRCPLILRKVSHCHCTADCSPSKYGRTIYIYPKWDLRLFTNIPRGSVLWKLKMKSRTSAERINDRILHDYGIENAHSRGKKRISFAVTIAAFNIHLDVQLKVLYADGLFDFISLFIQRVAA